MKPQIIATNAFILYPNPAKDYLLLLFKNHESLSGATAYITNMYGNKMLQQKLTDNKTQRISLAHLTNGWYIITVITPDGKQFTQRFLKQ